MNLFEVEGTKFIDNIPKDIKISIPKEEYAEFLILKEGCISKKKIENKIKELEEELKLAKEKDNTNKREMRIAILVSAIEVLKELLEE